jgi:2-amino-4-hydroxy-6-hydroxymethyldihydropteridine diphosphokinase
VHPESSSVFIGLGSNIEPRLERLRLAVNALRSVGEIMRVSSVYETVPVGGISQPDFLNAVIELRTTFAPLELVQMLKALEKKLGRQERPRWHEREIDLDVLFYGDRILETPILTVPHPEIQHRAFVLAPMSELDPDFQHPIFHKSVSLMLSNVDTSEIKRTDLSLL